MVIYQRQITIFLFSVFPNQSHGKVVFFLEEKNFHVYFLPINRETDNKIANIKGGIKFLLERKKSNNKNNIIVIRTTMIIALFFSLVSIMSSLKQQQHK